MTFLNAVLPAAAGAMIALDQPSTTGGGAAGRPAGPAAAAPEVAGGSWSEALAALLVDLAGQTAASESAGIRPAAGRLPGPPSRTASDDAEQLPVEPGTRSREPHEDNEWRAVPLPLAAAWLIQPPPSAPKTPETVCLTSGGAAEDGSRQLAPQPAGGAGLLETPVLPPPDSPAPAGSGDSMEPCLAGVRDPSDAASAPPSPPAGGMNRGAPPAYALGAGPQAGIIESMDAQAAAGRAPDQPAACVAKPSGMAETAPHPAARATATPEEPPPSRRPPGEGSEALPALPEGSGAAEPSSLRAFDGLSDSPPAASAGNGAVAVPPAAGQTAQPPDPAPPAPADVAAAATAPAAEAARDRTPAPLAFAARLVARPAGAGRAEDARTTLVASGGERSPRLESADGAGAAPPPPPRTTLVASGGERSPRLESADVAGASATPPPREAPSRGAPAAVAGPQRNGAPPVVDSAGRLAAEAGPDAVETEPRASGTPLARLRRDENATTALQASGPREDRPAARAAAAGWRSGETPVLAPAPAPGRQAAGENTVPREIADAPAAAQAVPREHRDATPAVPPAGELRLRLDRTPDEPRVEVRVTERGGEVRVAVRTPDTGLSQDLRQALPELIDSLDRRGYHTEIWRPGEADPPAPQRGEPRRTDADPASGQGFGNRDSAAGQGEPEPDRDRRPPAEAWEEAWHTTQRQWDGRTTQ